METIREEEDPDVAVLLQELKGASSPEASRVEGDPEGGASAAWVYCLGPQRACVERAWWRLG
jgi:hypothetical protein